jgi:hypothetical protein
MLTPEAKAFIAAQEPGRVTFKAEGLAQLFDTATGQIEALQYAVSLRERNKALRWRDPVVVAMRKRHGVLFKRQSRHAP